jgi:hypothetical protein
MGNSIDCCKEKKIINKLENVNKIENISEFLSEEIIRIGKIQNDYEIYDPYNNKERKSNISYYIEKDNNMNIEIYQYYLNLSGILVQIKIILDDFIQLEKDKENNVTKKNNSTKKYNNQIVDIKKTKKYLENILNTEDNYNLKKLEEYSNNIESNILSVNDDIN